MLLKIRILTISVLFTLCFAQAGMPATSSSRAKPQPPVQISIAPAQAGLSSSNMKPGEVVEFRVNATSMVDTQEMRITVKLTGGTELVSGELSWAGPAMKNEVKVLPVTIRVPRKGTGSIKAELSITLSGRPAFTKSSEYELGVATLHKQESARPMKKDSKGRNVVEYR